MWFESLVLKNIIFFKSKFLEYPHFVDFLNENKKSVSLDKKYHGCIVSILSDEIIECLGSLENERTEREQRFNLLCARFKKQYNLSNKDLLNEMVKEDFQVSEPLFYYLLNTKDLTQKEVIDYLDKTINYRFQKSYNSDFVSKYKQAVFDKLDVKNLNEDLLYNLQILFFKRLMNKERESTLEFLYEFSKDELNKIMVPIDINKNKEVKSFIESNFNECEFLNTSKMNCADFIVLLLSNNYKIFKDSLLSSEVKYHYISFLELLKKDRENIFENKIFFVKRFILNTIQNCGYEYGEIKILKDEFFRTVKELQEKDFEGKEQIFYYDFLKKVNFHMRIDSKSNVREFFKLVCEKINVEKIKLIRELPVEIEELNLVIKEIQEKKNTMPIKRKLK